MAAYTFSTLMCAGIASGVSRNSGDWLSTHPSGHANRQAVKTVMFLRTKAAELEKRLLQKLLTAFKRNVSQATPTFAPSFKGLGTCPLPQAKSTPAAWISFRSPVEKLCKTSRPTRKQSQLTATDHSKSDHQNHQFLHPSMTV